MDKNCKNMKDAKNCKDRKDRKLDNMQISDTKRSESDCKTSDVKSCK